MDFSRLRQGEQIAGVSAILLFVFMFLFDWFGVKVSGGGVSVESAGGGNAWDSMDIIPFILLIAIIAVVAMVIVRANGTEVDAPLTLIATVLSALGTLLILFRIFSPPDFGDSVGGIDVEATRKFGVYLGFLAAAAMTYGSWRTMEEEGASFSDAADRLGGGGGDDVGTPGPGGPAGGEPPSAPPPPPPPPPSSGAPPSV
jgi:purine-cytosine permease-like protein